MGACTCFCSSARLSHIEATIFDTSPKEALGFWPLMAACVSLKNRAYAETGFCGSFGSFFFRPFFAPTTAVSVAGFPPPLLAVAGETDDGGTGWEDMWERADEEERDMGESTSTLRWGKKNQKERRTDFSFPIYNICYCKTTMNDWLWRLNTNTAVTLYRCKASPWSHPCPHPAGNQLEMVLLTTAAQVSQNDA